MSNNTLERGSESIANRDEQLTFGSDAGPVPVDVELDEYLEGDAVFDSGALDCASGLETVEDDRQVGALTDQSRGVGKFPGRNPNRIQNVGNAMPQEVFRFLESRDRDWPRVRSPEDVDGLRGLDVRSQPHSMSVHA